MDEKNKFDFSNKKLIIVVVIVALLLVGGTLAATLFSVFNGNYVYKTTCFDILYDTGEDITGTLFPSKNSLGGLNGTVTIGIDPSCGVKAKGNLYLNVDSNTSSKFIETVIPHCENKNTLETMKEYTDSDTCLSSTDGVWVENGTALKYAVYNKMEQDKVISAGYVNKIGDSINIYKNFILKQSASYTVYIWLDGELADNSYSGLSFSANISATAEQLFNKIEIPVLDDGMIPVTISDDGVVTTVSEDDLNWYDYYNKKWANIVLVNENATSGIEGSKSREYYLNNPGTTVIESDILAYYVWIPRYKYKIWTTGVSSAGNEQEIDIQFESKNEPMSLGTNVGKYRTHPAFWWDEDSDGNVTQNEMLPGIWVGKFETTGTGNTPTVLPNTTSLVNQNVSTQFQTSLKFAGGLMNTSTGDVTFNGNNTYGLTIDTDSHMMKNSEWGAVAYLSHSLYGINDKIRANNYNNEGSRLTGCGALSENDVESSTCGILYGDVTEYPQSTTGNITGVYDMSGGSNEYMMGYYGNIIDVNNDSSGFTILPSNKYYNLYSDTIFSGNIITNGSLCTLEICGGHALYETSNWYEDSYLFVASNSPWFVRVGGSDTSGGGIFSSAGYTGESFSTNSWRSVLVSMKKVKVTFDANGGSIMQNVQNGETVSYTTSGEFVYTIPNDGEYRLEVWGAQGGGGVVSGSTTYDGGYGGYSIGNISLEKNDVLYFNIGGQGTTSGNSSAVGGYNGGGSTQNNNYGGGRGSGGGATHIALDSGLLSTFQNKKERLLIVAGGGGGGAYYDSSKLGHGGHAGGYIGNTGTGSDGTPGTGGTQDAGGTGTVTGTFGAGANAVKTYQNNSYGGPGGGGGYYGGGAAYNNSGGGGGSGYIANDLLTNKSMYCYGCMSSNDVNSLTYVTESVSEQPVSNYAKSGGGAAKITLLSSKVNTYSKNFLYNLTYGKLPIPEKEGYKFLGWYTEIDGGELIKEESIVDFNDNVTLYAQWKKLDEYTISYDVNGGTGVLSSQKKYTGETITLSTEEPIKIGYNFLGWSTDSNATSAMYNAGDTYTSNESITLYAVWQIKTYMITYDANGGSGAPTSQTKTYGVSLVLSSVVPTRDSYNFLGWSTSSNATSAMYNAGDTYTSNEGVTLYAVWESINVSPIGSYKCSNVSSGNNPKFTYTGQCTLIDDKNGNWRIKFLTTGTLTVTGNAEIDVFLVGGGGGGGSAKHDGVGGGGGGGGKTTTNSTTIVANQNYKLTIGSGGSGGSEDVYDEGSCGTSGGNTSGFNFTANGGGAGCVGSGGSGGSGGGAGGYNHSSSTPGKDGGSNGGSGGSNTTEWTTGGSGQGKSTYEFGANSGTLYSGGGGGGRGCDNDGCNGYGSGGAGGGGAGGSSGPGSDGDANTGGGGGGGGARHEFGGAGGSGIIVIRNKR